MGYSEDSLYCWHCDEWMLHKQEQPNHILWALLTIFTCGFWGIVWLIDSMRQRPWRCSRCGFEYDLDRARAAAQAKQDAAG